MSTDGRLGLEKALQWKPDIILLDIMLPGMNGTEVLSALRRKSDIPVIMITAMSDAADRIGALRYGADDYVVKPYYPGEVVARVQAVLRRISRNESKEEILRWANLEVNTVTFSAVVTLSDNDSRYLELTPAEFSILVTLIRHPSRPFSRLQLLELCLPESDALERVVDTHVYNLRKKLEVAGLKDALVSLRGVGYRFSRYHCPVHVVTLCHPEFLGSESYAGIGSRRISCTER